MKVFGLIPLFGLYYLFCATSARHPDEARIICVSNNCQTYVLPNGLRLNLKYAAFNRIRRQLGCAVFCDLQNSADSSKVLDRNRFIVRSSSDTGFTTNLFYTSHMAGLLLKIDQHPNQYPVAANSHGDYVFSWHSKLQLSEKEYRNHLATDTVLFIAKTGGTEQVLFKLVWAKRK
jgi:hypothetical protein